MSIKSLFNTLFLYFSLSISSYGFGLDNATNYVVIGAFTFEEHAQQHIIDAEKVKLTAAYAFNPLRNLFYVFTLRTDNKKEAFARAHDIRESTPFSDTWVYHGILGNVSAIADIEKTENVNSAKKEMVEIAVEPIEEMKQADESPAPVVETEQKVEESKLEIKPAIVVNQKPKDANEGVDFYFEIVSASTQKAISGDIDLIDLDKIKKVASYHGNEPVVLIPINKSGKISLECDLFGYRKTVKQFDIYNMEAANFTSNEQGQQTVTFEMVRLVKGDISVMYNVFFFKDAAVMRPESKYEITSLLEMMHENPNYRIKIHGHTNGSSSGKIITMGEGGDYFSLTNSTDGYGSAKKLSTTRSETMKAYLISQGIHEERILIKGWGGKRPIQDKRSNRANENVRVEVEILEN